jgi:hypothetical protein
METQIQKLKLIFKGEVEHTEAQEGSKEEVGFCGRDAANNKGKVRDRERESQDKVSSVYFFPCARETLKQCLVWAVGSKQQAASSGEGRNGDGCVFLAACQVFTQQLTSLEVEEGRKDQGRQQGGV